MLKVALLGWGSLLWDNRSLLNGWHDAWQFDGPVLHLEFSRISTSRKGALTLVIDAEHGAQNSVAWCLSRRATLAEAIADLQHREGTTPQNIGRIVHREQCHYRAQASAYSIKAWADTKNLDAVIWTDLPSNFQAKTGEPFSVAGALAYLKTLDPVARAVAVEYLCKAPPFIRTPLRRAFEAERIDFI